MAVFVDIHCHPTLKHYLYGCSIYDEDGSKKDYNYTNIQFTLPAMEKGEINVAMAAHYLPEKQILSDWRLIRFLKPILRLCAKNLEGKVEKNDAFAQTLKMMEDFEAHVAEKHKAIVAHNFEELQNGIENNKIVFVQTLEGAHHLGRGLSVEQYKKNIEKLKSKGIALITLGHFYPNDLTFPVEGIPPRSKKLLGVRYKPPPSVSLTNDAKETITFLLDKGLIVDLTHTNPTARKEIFELNRSRKVGMRPLVFSHVGVRALFKDDRHPYFELMCPDDDEITAIKECNGVIGIIFMNYWLTGKKKSLISSLKDNGFNYIVNTIQHIATVTGSFDNIAIGTDFDGMTDPPDDYYSPSLLSDFKKRIYEHKASIGASGNDIDKILGGNILRVLKQGWN